MTLSTSHGVKWHLGIGGILVSRLTTGAGGSFLATFHIPVEMAGTADNFHPVGKPHQRLLHLQLVPQ